MRRKLRRRRGVESELLAVVSFSVSLIGPGHGVLPGVRCLPGGVRLATLRLDDVDRLGGELLILGGEQIKAYSSDNQGPKYREYLTDCYPATAKMINDGLDRECEFMRITRHPFTMGAWTKLGDENTIQEAVNNYPALGPTKLPVMSCHFAAEMMVKLKSQIDVGVDVEHVSRVHSRKKEISETDLFKTQPR